MVQASLKNGQASQFVKWLDERIYLKMFIYLSVYDCDTLYIYYISFNTNSQMVQASLKNGAGWSVWKMVR
jgi:hypothetical protein